MKVEFTNRAVRDLREISDYSRRHFGNRITRGLEARIQQVITNIANAPESAPRIEQRPDMRVVLRVRYPFKIFYRIAGERSEFCTLGTPHDGYGTRAAIRLPND